MPFPNGLPKYRELDDLQLLALKRAKILNGCGPQSWKVKCFNWLYKADCFEHDYNYAAGYTEADRRWADWGFYKAMVKDSKRLPWYRQPLARLAAWSMYQAVRWFGKSHFNYSQRPLNVPEMINRFGLAS